MNASHLAAILLLSTALPAAAQTTVTLTARDSVDHFYWFGGFAISGTEGQDGAPLPPPGPPWIGLHVIDLATPTLSIVGFDHFNIHYLSWVGFLEETWDQSQTFSTQAGIDGAEIHASGHATISQVSEVCGTPDCFPASELHRSTNTQVLEFILGASNPYELVGTTSGGQYVDLFAWDWRNNKWNVVIFGALATIDTSFSLSGILPAGRYQLRNNPYTQQAVGAPDVLNAWDYTMRFAGAAISVPEPPTAMVWAPALAALACWRRARR